MDDEKNVTFDGDSNYPGNDRYYSNDKRCHWFDNRNGHFVDKEVNPIESFWDKLGQKVYNNHWNA